MPVKKCDDQLYECDFDFLENHSIILGNYVLIE